MFRFLATPTRKKNTYARLRDATHVSVIVQRSDKARSHLDEVAHAQLRVDEKRASLTRAHDAWALSRDLSSLNQISKGAGVHRRICSTLQAACRRALNSSAKRSTIASVRDKPCVLDHALMSPVLPTSGTGGHLFRCSSLPPLHSLNRRSSSVART